ncbi:DegT/DnrJ/EryC1/StrS family aminotransferase [Enterococcus gallinarum]|uniref:DegT/DnrJ/EryC1/StrS family aminotransferase n=1 Tax=Enterococcus gallinarum TaxID=1353 RepID=UPI003D0BFCDA
MRKIAFSPPDISDEEINNVAKVLKSGWITTGPETKKLEGMISDYCDTNKTVCLNSATAAMEMCLRVLGIGPGDEVITSAYTYTASASVIEHVGAKIIMVDTNPDSYEISYNALEKAITSRTKAIIPVDIAGVMCDYEKIFNIVDSRRNIFSANNPLQEHFGRIVVLADAAHSFGASYKRNKSGSVADFTSFSFHAVKNITTAEGGALTWKTMGPELDEWFYKKVRMLSLHGQTKDALEKTGLNSWEYDIIYPAYKCNLTDVLAALGVVQIKSIDSLYKRRDELYNYYVDRLNDNKRIELLNHDTEYSISSKHLLLTQINGDRDYLISKLAEEGIATNVHYKPLPLLSAYKNMGFSISDYPNALKMFKNEVTLPLHTLLSFDDIDYIAEKINYYLN